MTLSYNPQMARDAMAHYDAMYCDLIEMAEEMEEQAAGFRERAATAKGRALALRDRMAADGVLTAHQLSPMDTCTRCGGAGPHGPEECARINGSES